MIITRPFWQNLIEEAWRQRNVIWLMGIRRVGKTSLCQSLPDIEYLDCESPRVRQNMVVDPEAFLESKKGQRIIIDEIHKLEEPSELLKLAADYYPDVYIIATGSSTLGASKKFKDTLTGRKRELWLTPMLLSEMNLFGPVDLYHRFLFGGFPAFFMQKHIPEKDFQEWIDSYWAKDIQDFFSVGKQYSFQKFAELLLANSGCMFEATRFTAPCETTRGTITNYLAILEQTFVVHVIRPLSTHRQTEIVKAPKVYGFDTGFVCYSKGWTEIKQENTGFMWEHCVLNEIHGQLQTRSIYYWRDKHGHEIDFVMHDKNYNYAAIECKFKSMSLAKEHSSRMVTNFEAFRKNYPEGKNYVVASDINTPFERRFDKTVITFVNTQHLIEDLKR
jgi:predicted AAA+ superfamily ATPase